MLWYRGICGLERQVNLFIYFSKHFNFKIKNGLVFDWLHECLMIRIGVSQLNVCIFSTDRKLD